MFLTQADLVNFDSVKKKYEANPNHWKIKLNEIKGSATVQLELLIFHFILLGVGTTAGLLVFACEIAWAKCKYGYNTGFIFCLENLFPKKNQIFFFLGVTHVTFLNLKFRRSSP